MKPISTKLISNFYIDILTDTNRVDGFRSIQFEIWSFSLFQANNPWNKVYGLTIFHDNYKYNIINLLKNYMKELNETIIQNNR